MTSPQSANSPPHNPLQREGHFPPPFGLWGHLSRRAGITPPNATSSSNAKSTMPAIAPLDKAGASTRILLHDTQAHLEKFAERVIQLTAGVADAKRELVAVQKLYQEDHEQLVERMIGLANRCQTELQRTIGTPAQSSELRDALRAVEGLGARLEALDKKVDMMTMVGQTQLQALQNLQDQQGQILTALLPILPLLQAVPLHVESARDKLMDAVSDSKNDVKLRIADFEDHVKQSHKFLGNQIRSSVPQGQVKPGALALRPHVHDSPSELRQLISTSAEAVSPADRLAQGTPRFRSVSQKRPRSASPSEAGSGNPATSPSDRKKPRFGRSSGHTVASPARTSPLVSKTTLRRIHTPTVSSAAPPSSSHVSLDVSLLPAVMRPSDRPVRTPLADLDPRTPNTTLNPSSPASIACSVPKQPRGSRSTLHTRPSPSLTTQAGMPPRTFSTQSNRTQVQTLALAAAPLRSTIRTPPPTKAAPITPGSFKLPLPALGLSRTTTRTATATPPRRTTTTITTTLNRSASSLHHPALNLSNEKVQARSSRTSVQAQASRIRTRTPPLGLTASSREVVAVHDTPNGSAHGFGVGLPSDVGARGGTPRTPRLLGDASRGTGTSTRAALPPPPPPPPPPPSVGKPMSLRDRRAMLMLPEDRLRDEGKRFIPLDDEEEDDDDDDGDDGVESAG